MEANTFQSDANISSLSAEDSMITSAAAIKALNATKSLIASTISQLQKFEKIESAADVQSITNLIRQLNTENALPGYATPEKLCGIDEEQINWQLIAKHEYPELLNCLIRLFDNKWPNANEDLIIVNLFKLDENFSFIYEAFYALNKQLSISAYPKVFGSILEALITDEELLAVSLLNICKKRENEKMKKEMETQNSDIDDVDEYELKIADFMQLLIALPNCVANRLGREMPATFIPKNYGKLLLRHYLKSLIFVFKSYRTQNFPIFQIQTLSLWLQRIICHFCTQHDEQFTKFLCILAEFAKCQPMSRSLIQEILIEFDDSNAILKTSMHLLNEPLDLYLILGNAVLNSEAWRFCFMQKLTFQRIPVKNEALNTLVSYLYAVDIQLVKQLFQQLLSVWSKRTALQKLTTEEHLSISKLLILTAQCLYKSLKMLAIDSGFDNEVKRQLHDGLRHHLESPDAMQRYIGMKTVELIFNYMEKEDIKDEDRLHFEYEEILKTTKGAILLELEALKIVKREDEEIYDETKLVLLLEKFMTTGNNSEVINMQQLKETDNPKVKSTTSTTATSKQPLDSDDDDDDLKPFDMSNDISTINEKRPKFVLDLLSTLSTKLENYEIFEAAMSNAEQLIRNQLSQQDARLAVDLMQLFIPMEMQFYFENFEQTKFNCCVAICVAHPAPCAEYICREFHTENSRYNANLRILMLQILAATAKELSEDSKSNVNEKQVVPLTPNTSHQHLRKFNFKNEHTTRLATAQNIIRQRLKEKTRRFCRRPKPYTQSEYSLAKPNRFHPVVGTFFFSLIRGQRTKQMLYTKYENIAHDIDTMLLVNFLHTLSVIIMGAQNCPILPVMAREVFDLCIFIRLSAESRVRLATLELIGCTLVTTPSYVLSEQYEPQLLDIQKWLEDIVKSPLIGGETSSECREIASQILGTCYKLFSNE